MAALAIVSANPEEDPGYQESWDTYWARVRPQRSRPYNQTSRPTSPLKRDKENNPSSIPPNGGGWGRFICRWEKKEEKKKKKKILFGAICLNWGDLSELGRFDPVPPLKKGEKKKI
jgi:hypothetical protein